ncbi:hypothetical protein QAD02_017648 [Eretmocerus hayati]|uniref:Uncharacterized protein n=1 Tax=Eretmocerus hayati TaxID=131215 RepID=A0ACC2PFQ7_9HYME|nr:hypothetical protein QAD02_017648 [Eretmocerus hayati]
MLLLEYLHARTLPETKPLILLGFTIPPWMSMAYAKIGMFGFGAATTVLTTDVAKYTVGRLRPHFMTLCDPTIDCSLPENHHQYFEVFECRNKTVSARLLKELRLSFPSGHSSFSAYTMIYLALYLQLRMTWRGSKLLRHFLQFLCIMMAWFTAMTRISNYKHHWSDVMAGSTIGTVVALIVAFGIADLFKERRLSKDARIKFGHHLQQQNHQNHHNSTDDTKANNREYAEVAASSPELLHHHHHQIANFPNSTTSTSTTNQHQQQQVNNGTSGGHIC